MLNKSVYHTRSGSVLSDPELLQRMSRESVKSWHKPAAELPVPQMIVDCVIRDFHRTPVVEQEMMAVDLLVLGRVLKELTCKRTISVRTVNTTNTKNPPQMTATDLLVLGCAEGIDL